MTAEFVDAPRSDDVLVHLVRRLSLAVVTPACAAFVIGLVRVAGSAVSATSDALDAPTVPLHELASPATVMSPFGILTAGLAMLAALPAVTLLAIGLVLLSHRRWREALLTCGVLAMLGIAACLGHR